MIILYLVCFGCYILYTRVPDFFDGETSPAMVHWMYDSRSQRTIPKALFRYNSKNYAIDARYVFRSLPEGKKLTVIFEKEAVSQAAVFAFWGYWLRWQEVLVSVILLLVLFQMAVIITKNPTPEALLEQMEYKEEKKRKYIG
ncbi:hypothetical protein [Sediminibacterium soli]|uniref:hypothetical protein n=1 Tax=Sediminibacterium soli TaxID=2698829 RepID=UPI00137A487E|nr:hypothetical protein [Sediminibacterium soli]NCI47042.1 hypothetical protein [Sediminibacterium soli]